LEPLQKKAGFILGFVLFAIVAIAGWQIAASYVANSELQTDINDLAAQPAAQIGLAPMNSEDEFNKIVIDKAKDYGIRLKPKQVTVRVTSTPEACAVFLAADYEAPVNVVLFSFSLHFAPSTLRKWTLKRA
jgi:hypothetical protein